jgi:serine/threonine protein kinase
VLVSGSEPIPGYRLEANLGQGGFGTVWSAKAPDGVDVALKFVDCQGKPGSVVAQEIRMMRRLQNLRHPNFIRLHDVCASPPYIIIIMERADGSLRDLHTIYRQETGRNIPADYLLFLLEQAAVALDYLADSRLITPSSMEGCIQHCDVKPSNLLLKGDTLKVADFGLCSSSRLSFIDQGFRGTPPYAAPELYEGRTTSRTDQYGLAVTFCELCIGERVFDRSSAPVTGYPGLQLDLSKLRDREYQVLAKALAERWTDRWPSCRDFVTALKLATKASRGIRRISTAEAPSAPEVAR